MIDSELNALLKQAKVATESALAKLQDQWHAYKTPIAWEDFLLDKKVVEEQKLQQLKSDHYGVPIIDLRNEQIQAEILNLVPEPLAHHHPTASESTQWPDASKHPRTRCTDALHAQPNRHAPKRHPP